MLNSPKFLIVVALAGLGLFLVLIFTFPPFVPPEEAAAPGGGLPAVEPPDFKPSGSAFLPAEEKRPPELGPFSPPSGVGGGGGTPSVFLPPQQEDQRFKASIPSIEDITRAIGDSLGRPSVAPPASELLELPPVDNASLNITSDGPSELTSYIENFSINSFAGDKGGLEFDGKKFTDVPQDENGIPLLPHQLIELGLKDKNFFKVKQPLEVYKEFISAKKKFVASLPVSGGAVAFAKKLVAFDEMMLSLIDKAIAAADGQTTIQEVQNFYAKFQATADFHNEELFRDTGIVSFGDAGLFQKIATFLTGGKIAFAVLPFGTFIGTPVFCTCSASFYIPTGPPVPAPLGALNASLAWISSPALFPFKSLRPGATWLGNYSPNPVPCLQFILVGCAPIPGFGNPPIIAGTSI